MNALHAEMAWVEKANCAGLDAELFFPERGQPSSHAKAVCAGCEVREPCLQYALDNHINHGIWGGVSVRDRLRVRRRAAS